MSDAEYLWQCQCHSRILLGIGQGLDKSGGHRLILNQPVTDRIHREYKWIRWAMPAEKSGLRVRELDG
jgi:hypothetical protein